MADIKKIIQVGATITPGPMHANFGPIVLQALAAEQSFQVTVLTRKSSDGTLPAGLNDSVKLERIADDYPETELIAAFKGHDAVVLTTGFGSMALETRFVDAAAAAGVARIVLPQWGAPVQNPAVAALHPLYAHKAKVIAHARSLEHTGLSWTAVACGLFLDMVASPLSGFSVPDRTATVWDSGLSKWSTSTKEQAARAAVQVLKHADATRNRCVHVSSFETTQSELVGLMEAATGATWTKTETTAAAELEAGTAALKGGDMIRAARLALVPVFAEGYGADYAAEGILDNAVLGLETESKEKVVKAIVAAKS